MTLASSEPPLSISIKCAKAQPPSSSSPRNEQVNKKLDAVVQVSRQRCLQLIDKCVEQVTSSHTSSNALSSAPPSTPSFVRVARKSKLADSPEFLALQASVKEAGLSGIASAYVQIATWLYNSNRPTQAAAIVQSAITLYKAAHLEIPALHSRLLHMRCLWLQLQQDRNKWKRGYKPSCQESLEQFTTVDNVGQTLCKDSEKIDLLLESDVHYYYGLSLMQASTHLFTNSCACSDYLAIQKALEIWRRWCEVPLSYTAATRAPTTPPMRRRCLQMQNAASQLVIFRSRLGLCGISDLQAKCSSTLADMYESLRDFSQTALVSMQQAVLFAREGQVKLAQDQIMRANQATAQQKRKRDQNQCARTQALLSLQQLETQHALQLLLGVKESTSPDMLIKACATLEQLEANKPTLLEIYAKAEAWHVLALFSLRNSTIENSIQHAKRAYSLLSRTSRSLEHALCDEDRKTAKDESRFQALSTALWSDSGHSCHASWSILSLLLSSLINLSFLLEQCCLVRASLHYLELASELNSCLFSDGWHSHSNPGVLKSSYFDIVAAKQRIAYLKDNSTLCDVATVMSCLEDTQKQDHQCSNMIASNTSCSVSKFHADVVAHVAWLFYVQHDHKSSRMRYDEALTLFTTQIKHSLIMNEEIDEENCDNHAWNLQFVKWRVHRASLADSESIALLLQAADEARHCRDETSFALAQHYLAQIRLRLASSDSTVSSIPPLPCDDTATGTPEQDPCSLLTDDTHLLQELHASLMQVYRSSPSQLTKLLCDNIVLISHQSSAADSEFLLHHSLAVSQRLARVNTQSTNKLQITALAVGEEELAAQMNNLDMSPNDAIGSSFEVERTRFQSFRSRLPSSWILTCIRLTADRRHLLVSRGEGASSVVLKLPVHHSGRQHDTKSDNIDTKTKVVRNYPRLRTRSRSKAASREAVQLPTSTKSVDDSVSVLDVCLSELACILEASAAVNASIPNQENCSNEIKRKWWTERHELDERMQALLENLETTWFGAWKGLLMGGEDHESERTEHIKRAVTTIVDAIMQNSNSTQSTSTLGPAVTFWLRGQISDQHGSKKQQHEQQRKCQSFARYVLGYIDDTSVNTHHRNLTDQALRKMERVLMQQVDQVNSYSSMQSDNSHSPIILVVDPRLQCVPFESLPCMHGLNVTRMPSWTDINDRICARLCVEQARLADVDINKHYVLLNPTGDLQRTQLTVEPVLRSLQLTNIEKESTPEEPQLLQSIAASQLFIYCGHGSGDQLIARESVECLSTSPRIALLMGCSSGKFKNVTAQLDGEALVLSLIRAGCDCVVANLWDVTDGECDRFTVDLLQQMRALKCETVANNAVGQMVANARNACKLRYLMGAAPVVYGLPLCIK